MTYNYLAILIVNSTSYLSRYQRENLQIIYRYHSVGSYISMFFLLVLKQDAKLLSFVVECPSGDAGSTLISRPLALLLNLIFSLLSCFKDWILIFDVDDELGKVDVAEEVVVGTKIGDESNNKDFLVCTDDVLLFSSSSSVELSKKFDAPTLL